MSPSFLCDVCLFCSSGLVMSGLQRALTDSSTAHSTEYHLIRLWATLSTNRLENPLKLIAL